MRPHATRTPSITAFAEELRSLRGAGNFDDSTFVYEPGSANEVVAVRVFYEWELITPYLSAPLRNMSGNKHLLQATAVFRNEPFGS